jgi:hypothetical protein
MVLSFLCGMDLPLFMKVPFYINGREKHSNATCSIYFVIFFSDGNGGLVAKIIRPNIRPYSIIFIIKK